MKTIQELINFFEAIPKERWIKFELSNEQEREKEQNCAFGHLNKHLTGHWNYNTKQEEKFSWNLVGSLDISPSDLLFANNHGPNDAKTNVINFLQKKLKNHGTVNSNNN